MPEEAPTVPASSPPGGTGPSTVAAGVAGPAKSVSPGAAAGPTPGVGSHEWTDEVADRIESVVAAVRDKTTVPVVKLARVVVFGVVALPLAVVALILFLVALTRLIEVYLPVEPYSARVWGTYAVLGAIFVLAGLLLFSRRTRRR